MFFTKITSSFETCYCLILLLGGSLLLMV